MLLLYSVKLRDNREQCDHSSKIQLICAANIVESAWRIAGVSASTSCVFTKNCRAGRRTESRSVSSSLDGERFHHAVKKSPPPLSLFLSFLEFPFRVDSTAFVSTRPLARGPLRCRSFCGPSGSGIVECGVAASSPVRPL